MRATPKLPRSASSLPVVKDRADTMTHDDEHDGPRPGLLSGSVSADALVVSVTPEVIIVFDVGHDEGFEPGRRRCAGAFVRRLPRDQIHDALQLLHGVAQATKVRRITAWALQSTGGVRQLLRDLLDMNRVLDL